MKKTKMLGMVVIILSVFILQSCVTQIYASITFNNKSDYDITVDANSLYTVITFSVKSKGQEILTFEWPESVSRITVDVQYYGPVPAEFQGRRSVELSDGDNVIVDIENYPDNALK